MTASLHRLGAGPEAGNYYTNDAGREAKPRTRDEYYVGEGGGIWWSSGESVVRHGAEIDRRSFRDLCAGLDPRSGEQLIRGAGPGHWAGLDLTLTPGKSVSVLWAAGNEGQRELIEAAHCAAVDRALRFVVDERLIVVRTGAGGVERHAPSDVIVARFDHYTTREGDPNVHTHCVIMNVAGAPPNAGSGRYASEHLTIDPVSVFEWQRVIGAAYRAALAERLHDAFGVTFREAGQGQWEIAGVPEAVLERFSKRSAQIEARAGRGASSAQKEIAALATRQSKEEVPTGEALEARWRQELHDLRADPWSGALTSAPEVSATPTIDRDEIEPPEIAGEGPVARAGSALLRHESVIDRKTLLQEALTLAGLNGKGIEAVEAEMIDLERRGALIPLVRSDRSTCWTTQGVAACEARMLRAADRAQERSWFGDEAVAMALGRAVHLSDEQASALRHAVGNDGVALLEAGAGTGKTTTARALVDAAQASGLRVIGLAPSWVAADELSKATGIEALAIARWRHDLRQDQAEALNARTVLLVDEAGMVGTRDMQAVLSQAQQNGAKVVLIGDQRQLASVAGASALRAVSEVVERSAALLQVRRQLVDWQCAASVVMARGDAEAGLRAYASHDRVELVSGELATQERVIAVWREQRARYGENVLIITRRNRDAAALNARARAVLREEGRLGPDVIAAPSLDRSDKHVELALAVGDRIRFSETLPHLGIRNGNHAEVEAIRTGQGCSCILTLRFEDGRVIEEAWNRLAREPRFGRKALPPRVVHAYSGTVYAAQGRTSQAAVLHIASSTDAREVYVGLTRHQHDARVVVEGGRLDALCRQRQSDSRMAPTRTALMERLFAEASQYREKANVVDHVPDRSAFIRTGVLDVHARAPVLDVSRAVRAARALHEALVWLGLAPLVVPAWRFVQEQVRRVPAGLQIRLSDMRARLNGKASPQAAYGRGGPER